MRYKVRGKYPTQYEKKEWTPPIEELDKTARIGRITQVFKSKAKKMVYFLKKVKEHPKYEEYHQSTGWAEEGAGCKSNPQYSWCPEYNIYKQKVKACLDH